MFNSIINIILYLAIDSYKYNYIFNICEAIYCILFHVLFIMKFKFVWTYWLIADAQWTIWGFPKFVVWLLSTLSRSITSLETAGLPTAFAFTAVPNPTSTTVVITPLECRVSERTKYLSIGLSGGIKGLKKI